MVVSGEDNPKRHRNRPCLWKKKSIMGAMAVDLLIEGKTNRVVGYKHGQYVDFDIDEALSMKKAIPAYQYEIAKQLAKLYGEDKIVWKRCVYVDTELIRHHLLGFEAACRKIRSWVSLARSLGLVFHVADSPLQNGIYPRFKFRYWRLCYHYGRGFLTSCKIMVSIPLQSSSNSNFGCT